MAAQHQLVTKQFGIKKLVAVVGWSMGAGQVRAEGGLMQVVMQYKQSLCDTSDAPCVTSDRPTSGLSGALRPSLHSAGAHDLVTITMTLSA